MPRTIATQSLQAPQGPQSVSIPHLWNPRSYQIPLAQAMPSEHHVNSRNRIVQVWHRRSGKDLSAIALTAKEMVARIGYYIHLYPYQVQARKAVWDGKDIHGVPFLDRIPKALRLQTNESELQVVLKPCPGQHGYGDPKAQGSIWQVAGADEPDKWRGTNPVGVVFSEYSEMQEEVWTTIVRPILEENGGWAMFLYTPKGKNHSYRLFKYAKENPDKWFSSLCTVDDTRRDAAGEDGSPIVTPEQIEEMRREGIPEEIIQQEYYCSFEGFLRGTIYGDLVIKARKDKRICRVPWDSSRPVGCMWDIGRTDSTAIWFYQRIGQQICFIDYLEDCRKGADFYAKELRMKPYLLTRQILPHDAAHKSFTADKSPKEYLEAIFRGVRIVERFPVQSGIDAVRRLFSQFVFDEVNCSRGIECLENYSRKWDDRLHDFIGEPVHDEFSHAADSLRTGVVGGIDSPLEFFGNEEGAAGSPTQQETDFAIFDSPGMVQ